MIVNFIKEKMRSSKTTLPRPRLAGNKTSRGMGLWGDRKACWDRLAGQNGHFQSQIFAFVDPINADVVPLREFCHFLQVRSIKNCDVLLTYTWTSNVPPHVLAPAPALLKVCHDFEALAHLFTDRNLVKPRMSWVQHELCFSYITCTIYCRT